MTTDQKIFLTLCGAEAAVLLLCRRKTESEIGITRKEREKPIKVIPEGRPDALFEDFLRTLKKIGIDYKKRNSQYNTIYADFHIVNKKGKKYSLSVRNSDHLVSERPIRQENNDYIIELAVIKQQNKDATAKDLIKAINENFNADIAKKRRKN